MRVRFALLGITLTALIVVGLTRWRVADRPPPGDQPPATTADRPQTLILEARVWFVTRVDFTDRQLGPPPWPKGNCFDLSTDRRRLDAPAYRVVNIHAENFARVVETLQLDTVEVMLLDGKLCLVTDARIPREWLLEAPCRGCMPTDFCERLREAHPDRFRGS